MPREFRESVVFQASPGSAVSLARAEFLVFRESQGSVESPESVVSQAKVEFLESAVSLVRAEFLVFQESRVLAVSAAYPESVESAEFQV